MSKTVTCMTCMNAMLHRYNNNPVLASCLCQPQPYDTRFPYQVEVASVLRKCAKYVESDVVKTVQQRLKAV